MARHAPVVTAVDCTSRRRTSTSRTTVARSRKALTAKSSTRGAPRSVYVFVADPKVIRAEMGFAFDLIDSYAKVPSMLRGPIDDQAKQQLGYSITELLDPNSPVGAVVAAVKELKADRRAILLIDESAK